MFKAIARRLLGEPGGRALRAARRDAEAAGTFSAAFEALDEAGLAGVTRSLRARLEAGEKLDALLPEAFAAVREASRRVLGLRHYDVQLVGGSLLHRRKVAEMRTGEGKTLVAMLAAYLNALPGRGAHVVTVNEYLVRRDAHEAGAVLGALGMSVGWIVPGMWDDDRRAAYAADVTYVTSSEVGFDHLRDHTKADRAQMVLRPFAFAVVDEVDSVLIDEARTPLILSGEGPDNAAEVMAARAAVAGLGEAAWEVDLRARSAHLTDAGLSRVEAVLLPGGGGLHDAENAWMVPFVHQAVRARALFHRDRDYIVRDGRILLVDQGTGRVMEGRRFSEGLHQALEAKEGVEILPDNVTVASVTYQNLFRLYPGLSGMTGTASTEADELAEVYGLEVVPVPTNRPVIRVDADDEIYVTSEARDRAVADAVAEAIRRGQPVLVGTSSVERSDELSALFSARGIGHEVLNARQHEREAHVVAQAGRSGAVTIATNMAGRGTDIRLGGNPDMLAEALLAGDGDAARADEVRRACREDCALDAARAREAGGLLVVGTERHESRRVDDQLRGRSGRQGDPGASRFMVSLEDELMRRFGGEKLGRIFTGAGLRPDEPISHPLATRSLRKAQERCEAAGFDARRNLLKYDNVTNQQRLAFYARRDEIIDQGATPEGLRDLRDAEVARMVEAAMPPNTYPEQWDAAGLAAEAERVLGLQVPVGEWMAEEGVDVPEIEERLHRALDEREAALAAAVPAEAIAALGRQVLLQSLDMSWQEHLADLEALREGIGLRAYAQRDPLHEWHSEAANLFGAMLRRAAERAVGTMARLVPVPPGDGALPAPAA